MNPDYIEVELDLFQNASDSEILYEVQMPKYGDILSVREHTISELVTIPFPHFHWNRSGTLVMLLAKTLQEAEEKAYHYREEIIKMNNWGKYMNEDFSPTNLGLK